MQRYSHQNENSLTPNRHCPLAREINVLLLGQTGVGKTTFINALANYLVNDTLREAEKDDIQVIIPASFSFTDSDTFNETEITLGEETEDEKFKDPGQSNTQQCRSFIFPIGDRNLRLIDTPGIGDTRGLEYDNKNFQEILNYIAQYKHLNGVCILLKPNDERMTIFFRFCLNELLRHLDVGAKDNLIFVFTSARATFFMPGTSKRLLEELLNRHRQEHGIDIPFSKSNTFLVDNEPFRYLAIRKQGFRLDQNQIQSYTDSWDRSVAEYGRLMEYIVARPLHLVSGTLSLNEAEQLIRKLPRPIAETKKLIEENIQLAKDHKKRVLENPELALEGIPQLNVSVKVLEHPRTVCSGEKCCHVLEDGPNMKIEYTSICHDRCYLKGVIQETLYDENLQDCEAMNPRDGKKYSLQQ